MTKVAIYARYSSSMQREASIEDQIRLCEERAAREGWKIVQSYSDRAMSGASLMRPGIQELMQDARDGKFDLIMAESLDRLSRDQEDIAGVYKRMRFAGAQILTLSEGPISELHIGLKGTMGALYLKDLADKTRRGLRGRVEAGKSGGGNSYGYDVVKSFSEAGIAERGERNINEREAATVRHIFNEYAAGKSPRAIALVLNKSGIPGPSGKGWGASTINGNWRRGTGILNNELYIGRLVWNRLSYIKNPDTGKRVSRLNPPEDWIIKDVPELRIVDQELWDRVKDRQKNLHHEKAFYDKQRPRKLLSYLLKCGACGGGLSKISAHLYGCSTARNKGTCDNRLTVRQDELEGLVLSALQSRLMDPALLEEFCTEYTRHLNALRNEKNASLIAAKSELTKLAKERENLIQAIRDGVPASEVKDDLARITARREGLEELLDGTKEEPVLLHPNMASHYRKQIARLGHIPIKEDSQIDVAVIHFSESKEVDMARFDLTDFEWSVIQPLLPQKSRGVPRVDDRRVLNGIFWRLRTGAPWADIPARYGPHTTCVNRFNRWRKAGIWGMLLEAVSEAYDGDVQMIDSSSIRVHQHAANGQKKRRDPVAWVARAAA